MRNGEIAEARGMADILAAYFPGSGLLPDNK